MSRRIKGNINPVLILGTPENESFTNLYPDDLSADCTESTWQSLIRIERNRPGSKLQQATARAEAFRRKVEESRGTTKD